MRTIEDRVIWGMIVLATLLIVILFPRQEAQAQTAVCSQKGELIAGLKKKFGEEVAGTGLDEAGNAIVILMSPGGRDLLHPHRPSVRHVVPRRQRQGS
jgi:hypothetical protein